MDSRISHIPFYDRIIIADWKLFIAGLAYMIPLSFLLIWRPMLGVLFAVAPFALLLICHGRALIYLLIVASFLFIPLGKSIAILPVDVTACLLVAAYIVDLLRGNKNENRNPIARAYLIYLGVVFFSIALEGFTSLSIKFFLRQILLFLTFMAVAHFAPRLKIKSIFVSYVSVALIHSGYSLYQFLSAGGGIRAFGLAGKGYADHVMIGFLICAVYYLWSEDIRERIFWGASGLVMIAALAATQTRASAITAGLGLMVLLYFASHAKRRLRFSVPKKNFIYALVLTLSSAIFLALYTPVFNGIAHRFARMGLHASGTILLRLSLWTASIKAFWANPFFGIGAGNFPNVSHWVPNVRFDPIFYLVKGLSTHAIMMTALAETGVFGLITLALFYYRTMAKVYYEYTSSEVISDSAATLCLLAIVSAVIISSIYAGAWFWGNNSYHMALFFGLVAAFKHRSHILVPGRASV